MNWLEQLLPPALVRALGWTLVHSLWQGAVVALALAGLLLLLRQHRAEVRYRTAALGLLVLLLLASVTFVRYYTADPAAEAAVAGFVVGDTAGPRADGIAPTATAAIATASAAAAAVEVAPDVAPVGLQAWLTYFDQNLPVLVAAWLLGLLAMTLRLLGGLAYVQRLRRYRVQPLGPEWQARLAALAAKAGLQQSVELLESALVRAPVVVGHLRPVILLPLGTVTGLNTAYLEAILAHELAHVQRRDYVMNLLQSVAETVFFYHPAVWFISACLRTERENCCDDAAIALVGGNPLTVARALAALAELSVAPEPTAQFAMSALGPDGSVLGRIKRLVQGRTAPTFSEGFMAACVVLGGLVLLTSAVAMADPRPASESGEGALARLPFLQAEPDTTRKKADVAADFTIPDADVLKPLAPATTLTSPVAVMEEPPLVLTGPALVEENQASFSVAAGGEDDGKKKKRGKGTQKVVVLQEPTRRGRPGTVVYEKDKKGRITNLTIDGQVVDAATTGKQKNKGTQEIEVIRLPRNSRSWSGSSTGRGFSFNDTFTRGFQVPTLSQAERTRIRRDAETAVADARRQLQGSAQWRVRTLEPGSVWTDGGLKVRIQALQGAEQALQSTLQEVDLNPEQRERVSRELVEIRRERNEVRQELRDDVREQLEEARQEARNGGNEQELEAAHRELEAEMRRHNAEMRRLEAEMRSHDANMRSHDATMRRLEAERRRTDAEARRVEGEARRAEGEVRRREASATEEALRRELRKDGLIQDDDNFQFSLNATSLTVNGKKQPASVRDKYLRLLEKQTGRKLTGNNTFGISRRSTSRSETRLSAPPAPPTPPSPEVPAAPLPPAALGTPSLPRPPAPPRPPRFNSDQIRTELRKDGLLGADEKSFQFQLNDAGLTVNGKKQSAELTSKYRKLLGGTDSTTGKTRQNIQISVSE